MDAPWVVGILANTSLIPHCESAPKSDGSRNGSKRVTRHSYKAGLGDAGPRVPSWEAEDHVSVGSAIVLSALPTGWGQDAGWAFCGDAADTERGTVPFHRFRQRSGSSFESLAGSAAGNWSHTPATECAAKYPAAALSEAKFGSGALTNGNFFFIETSTHSRIASQSTPITRVVPDQRGMGSSAASR